MFKIKSHKVKEYKLIEVLFYTFPVSFIIGNLILSLHLLIFIIFSLFWIKKKQLTFRFNNSYWFLIFFFLYIFLSTTIQFLTPGLLNEKIQNWPIEHNPILKSFFIVRFLILVFIIDILFFNKILSLKKLLLTSLICTSFVSFDIIFQYIVGFDLFGFKSLGERNSGPFGDEIIAGSYLQKFSFFSIFFIFEVFKKKHFNNPLLIFVITLHLVAILLAGNKMPMILFLFGCVLIFFLIKNLRVAISLGMIIFLSIFLIVIKHDSKIKLAYGAFFNEINLLRLTETNKNSMTTQSTKKIKTTKSEKTQIDIFEGQIFLKGSGHAGIYRTSIEMWKERPLFGYGLKSFRIKCWEILSKKDSSRLHCSTHSHNYYLELLSEAGIIGTGLMIIFFLILLKDSFYYLKKYNQKNNFEMNLLMPVIIIVFLEIWPIRSTGSFFTTWNATFFWLCVALLLTASKQNKSNIVKK